MNHLALCISFVSALTLVQSCCAAAIIDLRTVKDLHNRYELRTEFLAYLAELFGLEAFVETGTYEGYSTQHAAQIFKQVYSVEIDPVRQQANKKRLHDTANIHLYTGDSVALLPDMIKDMGNKKALFWIDAHWPEVGSTTRYPIVQELQIIKNIAHLQPVILIDDVRDFDIYGQGLISVRIVKETIERLFPGYRCYVYGDTLLAFSCKEPVEASAAVQAMTHHRLYHQQPSDQTTIMAYEQTIAQGSDAALAALEDLAQTLPNTQHYSHWARLMRLHRQGR